MTTQSSKVILLESRSGIEFSEDVCKRWFKSLCSTESMIIPHDVEKLAGIMNKRTNDLGFLILGYITKAKKPGFYQESEWITGMTELRIDSTQKLLNSWIKITDLVECPEFERAAYRFCYLNHCRLRTQFDADKGCDEQRISISFASELIEAFLGKRWTHCQDFLFFTFLTEVKYLSKDEFNNIIDFSRHVTSLDNYDATAHWPLLMDEFVAHYNAKKDMYATGTPDTQI